MLTVQEVEDPSLKHLEGLTVQEIADQSGTHVIDAFLDLGVADDLHTTWVTPPEETDVQSMSEVANSPFALPGVSDGGAHTKFLAMGVYPTEMLSELVRDHGIMDLEQAHWRLSAYPAMAAGFKDRGWIKEGSPADIVIYDLENLGIGPMEKVVRPSRGPVAARAPGRGLSMDSRERGSDRGGRRDDRGDSRPAHPPRRRLVTTTTGRRNQTMPKFVLIGLCEPTGPDAQEAFDEWFVDQHIEDTAKCPNFIRGKRVQAERAARKRRDRLGLPLPLRGGSGQLRGSGERP